MSDFIDCKGYSTKLIQEYNSINQRINYRSENIKNDSLTSFWGFRSFYNNKGKLEKESHYGSDNRNVQTDYKYHENGLPFEVFSWVFETKKPARLNRYFYEGHRKML